MSTDSITSLAELLRKAEAQRDEAKALLVLARSCVTEAKVGKDIDAFLRRTV